ncbi:MAG: transporter [Microbacteriaceae bacterium]|nr:transporter [Microbacteriaceae bacterium]
MSNDDGVLTRKTVAGYAIGSLGTGGFATLPGLVLIYFLTDTLGVAAIAAGALVTGAKIWDVIIDPIIGARSDHSLAVTGSRRRYMLLGAVLLPVFFIITFAVPSGLDPVVSGLWVLVAFILTATAFSLFQVPYIALPAELAKGYDQRTRLLSWRVVVLTLAILLFGGGGPALRELGGADKHLGYLLMAVVAGLVIGIGMFVSSFTAKRGLVEPSALKRASIRANYVEGFGALRRSQPFRALLFTFFLQALATGLMLGGAQYVATWVLHSEDAVTFLFVALIAPALVAAPIWAVIARRIGKERSFVFASILFGLAALSMVLLVWFPGAWVYAPVALAGAAYAGMQSLPMSMLPDVISHDARANGEGRAGSFGGVWTAGETMGTAIGAAVLTITLAIGGYIATTAGHSVGQPPSAVAAIVLGFSVVPAVFMAASLVSLRRYRLRKADIDAAQVVAAQSEAAA